MRSQARHLPHASIAEVGRLGDADRVEAVDRLRRGARHGPFADARRPREQQRRRQRLALDRPREQRGQAAMADDVAEQHEAGRS